jgi:hypothetical protein
MDEVDAALRSAFHEVFGPTEIVASPEKLAMAARATGENTSAIGS